MPFLESKWANDIEGQGQWHLFSILVERILRCIFGAHLEILAEIHCKLSHGQAEFPRILSQMAKMNLGGPFFSISAESIPGCMLGTNLVIPAHIRDELSCGQGKVYGRSEGWTDAGNDNTPSAWNAKGVIRCFHEIKYSMRHLPDGTRPSPEPMMNVFRGIQMKAVPKLEKRPRTYSVIKVRRLHF